MQKGHYIDIDPLSKLNLDSYKVVSQSIFMENYEKAGISHIDPKIGSFSGSILTNSIPSFYFVPFVRAKWVAS